MPARKGEAGCSISLYLVVVSRCLMAFLFKEVSFVEFASCDCRFASTNDMSLLQLILHAHMKSGFITQST